MTSAFHQFLRSIDERRFETVGSADRVNARNGDCICDMGAVPSEEIIEAVCRSDCDVEGIPVGLPRDTRSNDQRFSEVKCFGCDLGKT